MMRWTARIVVGTDGSSAAESAVDWAAAEAHRRGVPLVVLTASEPDWVALRAGVAAVPTPASSSMPEHVAEAVRRVTDRWPGLQATASQQAGHPASVLIEASRTAGLVVVGARGRSVVAEVLLGSVSRHVSTHAHCPVVVVHDAPDRPSRPVVVGVDGSEASVAALRAAASEAEMRGTSLLVVHAWRDATYTGYGVYVAPLDLTRELQQAAEDFTVQQVSLLAPEHADLEVVMRVVQEHPVSALVRASGEAQLVVVGAHGRGHFPGMLQGSVASGVIHRAACPVMVMPAP